MGDREGSARRGESGNFYGFIYKVVKKIKIKKKENGKRLNAVLKKYKCLPFLTRQGVPTLPIGGFKTKQRFSFFFF